MEVLDKLPSDLVLDKDGELQQVRVRLPCNPDSLTQINTLSWSGEIDELTASAMGTFRLLPGSADISISSVAATSILSVEKSVPAFFEHTM